MRVYECGTGEAQACDAGTCAAMVAGVHLGLLDADEPVKVMLPRRDLFISWASGGDVMMTSPAETVFEDELQY